MTSEQVKTYPITPQPKPRITYQGKHTDRAKRYYKYCNDLRMLNVQFPECGAKIIFVLPMPKSWSAMKKLSMAGQPHQQKPDLKNLIAALEDAIYKDDSVIWNYAGLYKIWGVKGMIVVEY